MCLHRHSTHRTRCTHPECQFRLSIGTQFEVYGFLARNDEAPDHPDSPASEMSQLSLEEGEATMQGAGPPRDTDATNLDGLDDGLRSVFEGNAEDWARAATARRRTRTAAPARPVRRRRGAAAAAGTRKQALTSVPAQGLRDQTSRLPATETAVPPAQPQPQQAPSAAPPSPPQSQSRTPLPSFSFPLSAATNPAAGPSTTPSASVPPLHLPGQGRARVPLETPIPSPLTPPPSSSLPSVNPTEPFPAFTAFGGPTSPTGSAPAPPWIRATQTAYRAPTAPMLAATGWPTAAAAPPLAGGAAGYPRQPPRRGRRDKGRLTQDELERRVFIPEHLQYWTTRGRGRIREVDREGRVTWKAW